MSTQLFDAAKVMSYLVQQTAIVEQQVDEAPYRAVQYPDLVPVDTSGSEFATSVVHYTSDSYGRADWINGNADDIPLAGKLRTKQSVPVYTAGIGYDYGWEEINQAMLLNINLTADDAMAARTAADQMVDRVALLGDPDKGFDGGLFNSDGVVTPITATTGGWETATADEIIADINQALCAVLNGTNGVAYADTVVLPLEFQCKLSSARVGDTTMTIFQYVLQNNTYTAATGRPLTIRFSPSLNEVGAGDTGRIVAYRYDPVVLKLHMPMPHRFLPAHQDGPLRWVVPGVMRLGGLDIRRPAEVAYVDGL